MATTDTLLLAVASDYSVKIGLHPKCQMDSFNSRGTILGKVNNVSRIACSPAGELFCIRGEELYRGPMPSNEDVDWFSVARRVGKFEWSRFKMIFFHPNGDLYGITHDGEFYKGPQPDNEDINWMNQQATKIGASGWNDFDTMFFDNDGLLYGVKNDDKFYRAPPPEDAGFRWVANATVIGNGGWRRLTHFMGFTPDNKLWSVDKYNGNIYRGAPPTAEQTNYLDRADYLGWRYHKFKFLSFTKDKIIHNILSLEFLVDEGKKVSEVPEVISEKVYDNRESSSPLKHTFSFKKTIKESSSFSHEHGFTFGMEVETSSKTGIPFIAEGPLKISMNLSTTHNWKLTEVNETSISFSSSTDVDLEPGKAIRMVASVLKAEIDVPYKARAQTLFGSEVELRGMWRGVTHYHLRVKQKDYSK